MRTGGIWKKASLVCTVFLLATVQSSAQWVVTDPGNLAQGIINMSDNIAHTSKTATNTAQSFSETVKIYEQSKKYYDALKSVNNLVRDARKVREIILMVGDVSDIYVTGFGRMMKDENFSARELDAIAFGYTKLLEESNGVLQDLKQVIDVSTLSSRSFCALYCCMSSVCPSSILWVPCTMGLKILFIVPSTSVGNNRIQIPSAKGRSSG